MKKRNQGVIDINATNVMSRRERKRILGGEKESSLRNFFSKVVCIFGRIVNILLITNPIFFWLWALLAPEKTGNFLSDEGFWDTRIGYSIKKLSVRTAEAILPTGRLLKFMAKLGPAECSEGNQLKFFNYCRLNGIDWKRTWFSFPAQKRIWAEFHRYPGVAEKMVEGAIPTISDDEICLLIEDGKFDLVAEYSVFKTLSTRVMKALYASRQTAGKELFFSLIARHGAQGITPEMVCELDRPRLREALREFSQLAIVRREQQRREDGSAIFFNLAKSEKLFLRTEKEISLEQYNTLHSLCKNLSKEAILFKSNPKTNPDWVSWVDLFLKWEDLSFPEWELLMLRTPELRELVLKGGRKI